MQTNRIIPACLFGGVFALYLLYLCPGLYSGDSPLLSTSTFSLGLAHPPGYPLYVTLGNALTFIPIGGIAFKTNLLSALSGTLASLLVFMSVRELTEDNASSIFAALLAAFLPLAWVESTKAEVYTLNAALAMSVFYLGIRFLKDNADRRLIFFASFVLGVGMGNHHTIGFMVLPLGLAILFKARRPSALLYCLLFFCLGMSVYTFSYIRSLRYAADAALFSYSDAGSLDNFIGTFLRREYNSTIEAVVAPARDPLSFLKGTYNSLRYLVYVNMGAFGLLAIFSIPFLWKRKAELSFALTAFSSYAVVLASMVYAFRTPTVDNLFLISPYLIPLLYITSTLAGCGVFYLKDTLSFRAPSTRRPFALALVLVPLVFTLPDTLKDNNLSRYYLVEDYSENIMESLPPESVFLTGSDASYFPLAYKNYIERKRDDILLIHGDVDGLMLQATPRWRYSIMFADLPVEGPFSIVGEGYLNDKTVYAFEPAFLPDEVKKSYKALPYIDSFKLLPEEENIDEANTGKNFIHVFENFVYERGLKERASDTYSAEMKMSMFIPLSHYAYLMKKQGKPELSRKYYRDSLRLITPKGLAHYVAYLKSTGKKGEAVAFLDAIEPYAENNPEVRKLSDEIREQFL